MMSEKNSQDENMSQLRKLIEARRQNRSWEGQARDAQGRWASSNDSAGRAIAQMGLKNYNRRLNIRESLRGDTPSTPEASKKLTGDQEIEKLREEALERRKNRQRPDPGPGRSDEEITRLVNARVAKEAQAKKDVEQAAERSRLEESRNKQAQRTKKQKVLDSLKKISSRNKIRESLQASASEFYKNNPRKFAITPDNRRVEVVESSGKPPEKIGKEIERWGKQAKEDLDSPRASKFSDSYYGIVAENQLQIEQMNKDRGKQNAIYLKDANGKIQSAAHIYDDNNGRIDIYNLAVSPEVLMPSDRQLEDDDFLAVNDAYGDVIEQIALKAIQHKNPAIEVETTRDTRKLYLEHGFLPTSSNSPFKLRLGKDAMRDFLTSRGHQDLD